MAQRSNDPDLDLADLGHLSRSQLRDRWHKEVGEQPPGSFGRELLALGIAYVRQERRYGGFRKTSVREVDRLFGRTLANPAGEGAAPTLARPGTILVREWQGTTHHVTIVADGSGRAGTRRRKRQSAAIAKPNSTLRLGCYLDVFPL